MEAKSDHFCKQLSEDFPKSEPGIKNIEKRRQTPEIYFPVSVFLLFTCQ